MIKPNKTGRFIPPRWWLIIIKLGLLLFMVIADYFVITEYLEKGYYWGIFFPLFLTLLLGSEVFYQSFFFPISLRLKEKDVQLAYLTGKVLTFDLDEIRGYSLTQNLPPGRPFKGVLLYLKNQRRIEFTDVNLKEVVSISDYLRLHNIPFLGEEKSHFTIFVHKYKYA